MPKKTTPIKPAKPKAKAARTAQVTQKAQPGRSTVTKSVSWDPVILSHCLKDAKAECMNLSNFVMRELRRARLGRTKISDLSA